MIRAVTAHSSGAHEFNSGFSGVRVARSLIVCVVLCRSLFVCCPFSFGHCFVCPSYIYDVWLPLSYFKTFHDINALDEGII
jgi:hypothetical protein